MQPTATCLRRGVRSANSKVPTACEGDLDLDGQVAPSDVLSIPSEWGCTDRNRSVDGNNATGLEDGIAVLAVWEPCTG